MAVLIVVMISHTVVAAKRIYKMTETITCYDGTKVKLTKQWHHKVDAICKEVLKEITPSDEMLNSTNKFCKKLQNMIGKEAKVQLCSSLGKGTNLR